MEVKPANVYSQDATLLIYELNEALIAIIGNAGTQHVNLDDFTQKQSAFFVGYEGETPVCCAGIRLFSSGIGEAKRVYARKHHKGIASQLMAEVERWADAHGYCKLILECREKNQHAITFYKRIGYHVCEKYAP